MIRTWAIAYLSTAVVFLGVDYLWLTRVATGFYRSQIGEIMSDRPNIGVAALFYIFYAAGIVYFAVLPGLQKGNPSAALLNGALLGLLAYGAYDLTNMATLKVWSLPMTVVDMLWGAFLTAGAAGAGYWAASALRG